MKNKTEIRLGEIKSKTEVKVLEWEIPDFWSLSNCKNDWYTTSRFHFENTYWYFSISPGGDDDSSAGYIALTLHTEDHIGRNFAFILELGVKRAGDMESAKYELGIKRAGDVENVKYELVTFNGECNSWRYPDFFLRKELLQRKVELLPDGTLTIICSMTQCDPNMPVGAIVGKLQQKS